MKTYLANLLKYKDLFFELIKKDIKLKYRHSYLGLIWSMLNPLLMASVLTLIFSAAFNNNIAYFPVYVLIGRIVYSIFAESTNFAMDSIVSNGNLIRKVYVPKYFFPLSRVFSSFIINFTSMATVFIFMLAMGMHLSWHVLFTVFPYSLLFAFTMGVGLFLSACNVFFRDIKHLYSVILTLIMYSMAIFYPMDIIPEDYRYIFELNPLFIYLRMIRDLLMYQSIPRMSDFILSIVYALVSLIIGLLVFYKSQDKFIHNI